MGHSSLERGGAAWCRICRWPCAASLCAGLGFAVAYAVAAGCGARTELRSSDARGMDVGDPDAGSGGSDGGSDATAPRCVLQPPGPPVVMHEYADRDLHTPSAVAVSPGSSAAPPGSPDGLARIALQAVSSAADPSSLPDGIEVGLIGLTPGGWPDGLSVVEPFFLLGDTTLTYAQMERAPEPDPPRLALCWNGEQGTQLGMVTVASWSAAPPTTIQWNGSTPLGLAAGAGVDTLGVGYEGYGYGMTWDAPEGETGFVAAVLDGQGNVVLGPHLLLGAAPSSGARAPSVLWSGEAYLLATGVSDCHVDDPLCVSRSVVLSRVRPASGDAWDDSGIDLAGSLPALETTTDVGYASLASVAGSTAVAWHETTATPQPPYPWSLRMALIDPSGAPLGEPVLVRQDTTIVSDLRLTGADFGFVVVQAEDGDLGLPDEVPGRSRVLVYQLDAEVGLLAGPIPIAATRFGSYGYPAAVGLEWPRGVLVTWSGRHPEHERRAVFATFLPCVPETP